MMVVASIIGILTAIAVPKFTEVQRKSKESALKTNLQVYRSAVYVFFSDTGLYPQSLNDLAATTQPANGLTPTAAVRSISPGTWRGPYVQQIQFDTVSGKPLTYSVANGSVGTIKSSATGNDSNGVAFSTY
ncbi:MAG: hypothetical protein KF812_03795 [Fimbriimonadaceae bacterium]|nr:hypothetical protein [Fimbriimonadaceae bacterium]